MAKRERRGTRGRRSIAVQCLTCSGSAGVAPEIASVFVGACSAGVSTPTAAIFVARLRDSGVCSAGRVQPEPAKRSLCLSDVQNSGGARRLTPTFPLPFPPLPNSSNHGGSRAVPAILQNWQGRAAPGLEGSIPSPRRGVAVAGEPAIGRADVRCCHGARALTQLSSAKARGPVPARFREDGLALEMPVPAAGRDFLPRSQ